MRKSPLPLIKDMAAGDIIERCNLCGELTMLNEMCRTAKEADRCPPRADVEALKVN